MRSCQSEKSPLTLEAASCLQRSECIGHISSGRLPLMPNLSITTSVSSSSQHPARAPVSNCSQSARLRTISGHTWKDTSRSSPRACPPLVHFYPAVAHSSLFSTAFAANSASAAFDKALEAEQAAGQYSRRRIMARHRMRLLERNETGAQRSDLIPQLRESMHRIGARITRSQSRPDSGQADCRE